MSKIALSGNASGTGTFTIASPNSNTDRTLNLPDAAGTIVAKSGTYIAPSELGAGTANSTTFLRGDSTWATVTSPTVASTAEAQAGTNNTNFITPLRMREGFNATGSAPVYACRAWVNFDGTSGSIRASGNVSSVTVHATGDYTLNIATALPDINFSMTGTCSSINNNCPMVYDNSAARARTTTSASIRTMDIVNFGNPVWANVSIFR
jgi:hypothetical protein